VSHRRDFPIGARVELHPATDDWMRGDRYGTVVGYGRKVRGHHPIRVKLDKSNRVKRYSQELVTVIARNPVRRGKRTLTVPETHQLRIAQANFKMHPAMTGVLGGGSPEESREIIKRLTGRDPGPPPYLKGRMPNPRRRPRRKRNPALHSAKVIGSNMIEVDHGSLYVLYSYETPVAIRPREGVGSKPLVTSKIWSRTTSKHIGVWLRTHGYTIKDAVRLPQEEIDAIAKRGYYAKPSMAENPSGPRAKFRRTRVRASGRFARGSMRTIKLPSGKEVVLGHLRGERRRTKRGRVKQTVQAILTPKRRHGKLRRRNPVLGVLGNPPKGAPRGTFLGKVSYLEYRHGTDLDRDGKPKAYYHHFRPQAYAVVTPSGQVVLYHPSQQLWKLFPVPVR
jgi:hypothetical protein